MLKSSNKLNTLMTPSRATKIINRKKICCEMLFCFSNQKLIWQNVFSFSFSFHSPSFSSFPLTKNQIRFHHQINLSSLSFMYISIIFRYNNNVYTHQHYLWLFRCFYGRWCTYHHYIDIDQTNSLSFMFYAQTDIKYGIYSMGRFYSVNRRLVGHV